MIANTVQPARALLGALILSLTSLWAIASEGTPAMPAAAPELLDVAIALARSQTLEVETLTKALGITLDEDATASNRFFRVYRGRGRAGGIADEVELRLPAPGSRAKGPLLHLTIAQPASLDAARIISRLGRPQTLRVPPPQAAATGAAIYVYRAAQGELRFGIGPAPAELVLSVTIDRTE